MPDAVLSVLSVRQKVRLRSTGVTSAKRPDATSAPSKGASGSWRLTAKRLVRPPSFIVSAPSHHATSSSSTGASRRVEAVAARAPRRARSQSRPDAFVVEGQRHLEAERVAARRRPGTSPTSAGESRRRRRRHARAVAGAAGRSATLPLVRVWPSWRIVRPTVPSPRSTWRSSAVSSRDRRGQAAVDAARARGAAEPLRRGVHEGDEAAAVHDAGPALKRLRRLEPAASCPENAERLARTPARSCPAAGLLSARATFDANHGNAGHGRGHSTPR